MLKSHIRSPEDFIAYILDCNLATVEDFCMKKNIVKCNFDRAIEIAQTNLDYALEFHSDISKTRGQEIVDNWGRSVREYATAMRERWFPTL